MKRFLLLALGHTEPTREMRDAWARWFDAIKVHVVDSGNPLGASTEVTASGARPLARGNDTVSGYTIIRARDMTEAEEIARGCPAPGGFRIHELSS